jgi:hypothetical protein
MNIEALDDPYPLIGTQRAHFFGSDFEFCTFYS